jgi:hypothetical protein
MGTVPEINTITYITYVCYKAKNIRLLRERAKMPPPWRGRVGYMERSGM